jgi:hypothetical protein
LSGAAWAGVYAEGIIVTGEHADPQGADQKERAVAARPGTPSMPAVPADTIWREPRLIGNSGQVSLGWQDARKIGPCFIVGHSSGMGSVKVIERFPLTEEGWSRAWAALTALDADAAGSLLEVLQQRAAAHRARQAEKQLRQQMYQRLVRADDVSVFRALGVQVIAGDDQVYSLGINDLSSQANTSKVLGTLSGAQAMVTDGAQAWSPGRAMVMPLGLAPLATKTRADAAIVFRDGTVHTASLDGNAAVREAQLQVVRFNALADTTTAPAAPVSGSDHAARLRALQELRDSGLISEQEYEAKRTEIIASL